MGTRVGAWLLLAASLAGGARADEAGPVGLDLESPRTALVAVANGVRRVPLGDAPLSGPAVIGALPDGMKAKSPATCPACRVVWIVAWEHGRTPLLAAPRDGSAPAREVRAAREGSRLKHVAVDASGRRGWATDKAAHRVLALDLDPETGTLLGEREWLRVEEPYDVTALPDGGVLVTTQAHHLLRLDAAGAVAADWDVAAACGHPTLHRGPLRAAKPHPSGAVYVLVQRSVLRLDPTPDGRSIGGCTLVAGDPRAKGSVDGCGPSARFASPHDLALVAGGDALLVSDTRNDALRSVSLVAGAGYGCTRTIPLRDGARR